MEAIITLDVEWDRKKDKTRIETKNLENIPKIQKIFTKYKVRPVYFCTYECLLDKSFIEFITPFVLKGEVEIGAHLHPWSTPPYFSNKLEQRKTTIFPHELSELEFEKKLITLTTKIQKVFGVKPISYRAGRFGISHSHFPILIKNGYKIDSSFVMNESFKKIKGSKEYGKDFRKFNDECYTKYIFELGEIFEIPITTFKAPFYKLIYYKFKKVNKILWFRIYPNTKYDVLDLFYQEAFKKNFNYIVYMQHSNEFSYKNNPYFKTIDMENELLNKFDLLMKNLQNNGVKFSNFRDFIKKHGKK